MKSPSRPAGPRLEGPRPTDCKRRSAAAALSQLFSLLAAAFPTCSDRTTAVAAGLDRAPLLPAWRYWYIAGPDAGSYVILSTSHIADITFLLNVGEHWPGPIFTGAPFGNIAHTIYYIYYASIAVTLWAPLAADSSHHKCQANNHFVPSTVGFNDTITFPSTFTLIWINISLQLQQIFFLLFPQIIGQQMCIDWAMTSLYWSWASPSQFSEGII